MESIKEFPRGINSDQVISANKRDGGMKVRAPGPGLKLGEMDIASSKQQATSNKLQATSFKPQASSYKQQASSVW
jgi:Tfp pilus assembly protein PilX